VVSAVLLDLDDTIVDSTAAMLAAGTVAAAHVWPDARPDVHRAAAVRFRADPRGLFGEYTRGRLDFAAMRQARLADVAAHLGLPDPGDTHARFEAAYAPAFAAHLRAFDDVAPLLAQAAARRWPVGVLTNSGAAYTDEKLRVAGLEGAFGVVVTTDDLGFGKPDARVFTHACARLGTAPGHTAYVGDDPRVDAGGAAAAGLYGVWLRRAEPAPWGSPGDSGDGADWPGPRVSSLADVVPLLARHEVDAAPVAGPGALGGGPAATVRGTDLGTGVAGR